MGATELDPPITDAERAFAIGPGAECGCTGRCRQPPHFTCSGKPLAEQIADTVAFLRAHPDIVIPPLPLLP